MLPTKENHDTGRRDFHLVMNNQDQYANVNAATLSQTPYSNNRANSPGKPTMENTKETKHNATGTATTASRTAATTETNAGTKNNTTTKQPWRTWFANVGGPQQIQQPPIPEPEFPRIAPTGTGISLRPIDIPPASLENIRNACHFYELKSSGKYSSKTLAGRYIFQLSREVQRQIVALEKASQAKMRRIEYLENLVRNWEETFGKPSDEDLEHVFNLKGNYSAVLSPIRLASLLRNRLKENETLKKEINKMLQSKQDEIDKAEKAISDHFKQTREQFRRDSERLTTKVEKELNKLESEKEELLQNNKKYLNEMTIKIHDAANASLQKERNDINKVVAAKVAEGLKEAYAKSNRAIQQTEMERRNHATEYLRRNQGIKKRELMIDTRLMGLKDRHTKEMSGMKARYARMFKEMQEKMEQNTMKNQHLVEELSTENVWLRQRVADLQEMVVAFQDAMTLN